MVPSNCDGRCWPISSVKHIRKQSILTYWCHLGSGSAVNRLALAPLSLPSTPRCRAVAGRAGRAGPALVVAGSPLLLGRCPALQAAAGRSR